MAEERHQDHSLSAKEFKFICDYVHSTTGILLNESKREMVYRRFSRIIRERQLDTFSDYCRLLQTKPEQEENYFINAITTNLTSFFREKHHFDYLKEHEIPRIISQQSKSSGQKKAIRIWSSASSTGEEPYSISITLMEAMKAQLQQWDVKILATDIDSNVLAKGAAGVYDNSRIDDLPKEIREQYFVQGTGLNSKNVKVTKPIRDLITFKQLNLLHDWPMTGLFDVIFCRNVIIYFDKPTQQELFSRYYEYIKPGGLLILGHSENLGAYQKYFSNGGRTIFRKPDVSNKAAMS
jgi:chemotaxis protein methyltransferase CheR